MKIASPSVLGIPLRFFLLALVLLPAACRWQEEEQLAELSGLRSAQLIKVGVEYPSPGERAWSREAVGWATEQTLQRLEVALRAPRFAQVSFEVDRSVHPVAIAARPTVEILCWTDGGDRFRLMGNEGLHLWQVEGEENFRLGVEAHIAQALLDPLGWTSSDPELPDAPGDELQAFPLDWLPKEIEILKSPLMEGEPNHQLSLASATRYRRSDAEQGETGLHGHMVGVAEDGALAQLGAVLQDLRWSSMQYFPDGATLDSFREQEVLEWVDCVLQDGRELRVLLSRAGRRWRVVGEDRFHLEVSQSVADEFRSPSNWRAP